MYTFGALFAICVTSCTKSVPNGKGSDDKHATQTVTKSFDITGFNGIHVNGSDNIHYTQGDKYEIVAKGNEKDIKSLHIEKDDSLLTISRRKAMNKTANPDNSYCEELICRAVDIFISSPKMEKVRINGSGDFTAKTPVVADKLSAIIKGSGDIHFNKVEAGSIEGRLSGSGDIKIGHARTSGVSLVLAGSGDIDINMENSGDVVSTLNGSGDITLKGHARSERSKVNGPGNINKKGLLLKNEQ